MNDFLHNFSVIFNYHNFPWITLHFYKQIIVFERTILFDHVHMDGCLISNAYESCKFNNIKEYLSELFQYPGYRTAV